MTFNQNSYLYNALKTNEWIKIFILSYAIIFGAAFALFSEYSYDIIANPDIETYLNLANFDFDQSPVRRYRIIIPLIAAGINFIFEPVFSILKPWNFPNPNFSLCLSFFVVNSLLVSLFGVIVYRLCKEFGATKIGALIGLLSVLTCRWTPYFAGLPIVDSLYLVIIGITLLGIKTKNSSLIVLSIFIGPWAKESFIFIAPLIFIYAPINRWKQLGFFALSGVIIFAFRYYFDSVNGLIISESIGTDVSHIHQIIPSLKRLFSFHGLYEVFSIVGIWGFFFLLLVFKNIRTVIKEKTPFYFIVFLMIVLIHALLSTDLARMFYLAIPITAIWFSLIFGEFFAMNDKMEK